MAQDKKKCNTKIYFFAFLLPEFLKSDKGQSRHAAHRHSKNKTTD